MITFDNVTYRYANTDHDAVRNISFTVKPGELKIVTGASGCGKTTLMRLTNGLAPQVYGGTITGSVTVAGKNVSQTPVAELAEDIGTLFQDPEEQFFALNVGNEIAFALRSRGVPADAITERVDAAVRRVGIESLVKQDIHALSEGQKQKVGLADILALGPKVLILDEPSANLDPEATAALAQTLIELKHQGCAILVVDHRLYWLRDAADAVIIMQKGEIRETGPYSILSDPSLRSRLGLRKDVVEDAKPGITALIGKNGAGKTTLARILTGLNTPQHGRFTLSGRDLSGDKGALMPHTGLVLQNADHQLQMRTVLEEIESAVAAQKTSLMRRKGGLHALKRRILRKLTKPLPAKFSKASTSRIWPSVTLRASPAAKSSAPSLPVRSRKNRGFSFWTNRRAAWTAPTCRQLPGFLKKKPKKAAPFFSSPMTWNCLPAATER